MLFWVSRLISKLSGLAKQASSRLAEPNMKNTRSSGSKSTPPNAHGFATRRGDIPIGAIQRAYSSNTSSHFAAPPRTSAHCSGCVSRAEIRPEMSPDRAGVGVAGLVLSTGDRELYIGADSSRGHACRQQHTEDRRVGMF